MPHIYAPSGELVAAWGTPYPALDLPSLITTLCPNCQGYGSADEHLTQPCEMCDARGIVEVCNACGVRPDGQTDVCACDAELIWARSVGWL